MKVNNKFVYIHFCKYIFCRFKCKYMLNEICKKYLEICISENKNNLLIYEYNKTEYFYIKLWKGKWKKNNLHVNKSIL